MEVHVQLAPQFERRQVTSLVVVSGMHKLSCIEECLKVANLVAVIVFVYTTFVK